MRINFKHIILFVSVLFFEQSSAFAQWDTTWIKTYGGNRDDVAMDMIVTPDNGFLMIGSTSSFGFDNSQLYFLKLDSIGNIMWSKSHGGPGQEHGTALIQTSDGGYVGVGYTNSWGEGGFDIFLVKLDANGNLEYEAVKGGFDWDFAWDVTEPSPGKYVIAAETQSFGNGNSDGWLLQFDNATQSWEWETTVGTSSTENLKAVTKGNNNDFFAVGMGHANTPNDSDIMVVRFNAAGDSLNTYFYGDTLLDFGNDITIMSDGNMGITGQGQVVGANPGILLLKIDSLGTVIFDTAWTNPIFSKGVGIKVLSSLDNRFILSGYVTFVNGNTDMFLGYSPPNSKEFGLGATLGENSYEIANTLINLEGDGFAISGPTNGYNNLYTEILMYKTDTNCVTFSNDFDNVKDTVNVVGIQSLTATFTRTSYNSALGEFTILSGSQDFVFQLYNLSGQLINQGRLRLNQPKQIAPNATSGMYIIRATGLINSEQITQLLVLPN